MKKFSLWNGGGKCCGEDRYWSAWEKKWVCAKCGSTAQIATIPIALIVILFYFIFLPLVTNQPKSIIESGPVIATATPILLPRPTLMDTPTPEPPPTPTPTSTK